MTISAILVLFAVIWFMVLFILLPIGLKSQDDMNKVVPGTPASAPDNLNLGRKAIWVTIISLIIWVPACLVISSGAITVDDLNFYKAWGAPSASDNY